MKRIHPNLSPTAVFTVVVWSVVVVGCRNQPGGMPNPFLAPDRVPPPATRTILPGQAQPYYPGDPLPVMQSATTPRAPSSSNTGLSWNSPSGSASAASSSAAPPTLAFSNERAVAIPTDSDSLRFALPRPEQEPIAPIAAPAAQAQQPVKLAAASFSQLVQPVSYAAPIASIQSGANSTRSELGVPPAYNPWRAPQIALPSEPTLIAVPPTSPTISGLVPQPNTMDVRLRALPSPPPEPVQPSTPRIRLPSYAAPPPMNGASLATDPVPLYATAMSVAPASLVQTVQISPLPPTSYDPTTNLATAPGAIRNSDGFRPRSSMR